MTQNDIPRRIGDEALNPNALQTINRSVSRSKDERVIVYSGFDYDSKVIAVTSQRVLIAHKERGIELASPLSNLSSVRRDGRTLILKVNNNEESKYRMGNDEVVQDLVGEIRTAKSQSQSAATIRQSSKASPATTRRRSANTAVDMSGKEPTGIAEKVRFWQEQDKINQELIPRVIRQHELLTTHIKDHETLPQVAADAARQSVAQAMEETNRQLETASAEREELSSKLEQAIAQQEELTQQLQQAKNMQEQQAQELEQAKTEREKIVRQFEQAKTEREQQSQELEQAKAERAEQQRQHQQQAADMKRQNRRIMLLTSIAVTGVTAAIALSAIL